MAKKKPNVNVTEAVAWAASNYERVIHLNATGQVTLKWDDALTPPPSDLARSYMRFASNNPTHFFSRTVPQFLGEEDAATAEEAAHDKELIATIRATLRKFTETTEVAQREAKRAQKKAAAEASQEGSEGEEDGAL